MLKGSARVTTRKLNSMKIHVRANKDSFLFAADTNYPGWKAFVDRKPVKLYSANYCFRAVYVPKGSHEVSFVFTPTSLRVSVFLCALGLVSLCLWALREFFTPLSANV